MSELVQKAKFAFTSAQNSHDLIGQGVKDCSKYLRVLRKNLKKAKTVGKKQ